MSNVKEFGGLVVGQKARLASPGNGRDHDREQLKKHDLKEGDELTVQRLDVHSWTSSVYFEEFPGIGFNTVQWEGV